MMATQIAFDFDSVAPTPPSAETLAIEAAMKAEDDLARGRARRQMALADARVYWKVGMVTSLPIFCTVLDSVQRFTQMLPGVIESITADKAAVRIYAAPEFGYTLDNYPLHRKLAIDVPLVDLGRYHGSNAELARLVSEGRLEAGDEELAARIRARGIRTWPSPVLDVKHDEPITEAI